MSTDAPVFCVNHPKTETLLRCNKCGKPVCIKCVERTPVGYRCNECLNVQHAGYYTATPMDYALTAIIGTIAAIVAGGIAAALGGFWFFAIFYAPAAGGIIAEIIRRAIQKRRGKYIWLVACATLIVGGFIGASALPILFALGAGRLSLMLAGFFGVFFNLGVWIFIVLGVSTMYARLRS